MTLIEWMPMILALCAGVIIWVYFKKIEKEENKQRLTKHST